MTPPRIAYVDDDQLLGELMGDLVHMAGDPIDLQHFNDPCKFLAYFQDHRDDYDAIVLDYNMPGLTGVELYEQLRQLAPVNVLFYTSDPGAIESHVPDCPVVRKKIGIENTLQDIHRFTMHALHGVHQAMPLPQIAS